MAEHSQDLPLKLAQARQDFKQAQARVAELEAYLSVDAEPPASLHLPMERRFQNLIEYSTHHIALTDAQGRIFYANAVVNLFGYTREEFIRLGLSALLHLADLPRYQRFLQGLHATPNTPKTIELRSRHQQGHDIWVEITATNLLYDPDIQAIVLNSRDITERKRAEEQTRRLHRTLTVLSEISQSIIRIQHIPTLLEKACQIAVEKGDFCLAWIGLNDPATGQVNSVALAERTDGDREKLNSSVDDERRIPHPLTSQLRIGERTVCNDLENDPQMAPWRAEALRFGYRAAVALPLRIDDEVRGTFNLYADELNFFDAEELKLVDEMALDLSFAMAFAEKEAQRQEAEAAVKRYAQRMEILHNIDTGIIEATSIPAVVEAALKHMRQLIPCQRVAVILFDWATEEWLIFADDAHHPSALHRAVRHSIPPGWQEGFGSAPTRIIDDLRLVPAPLPVYKQLIDEGLVCGIQALLTVQGKSIGLLGLNADTPGFFTVEHQEIASQVAGQLAIAIHQMRLSEEAVRHAAELERYTAEIQRADEALRRSETLFRWTFEQAAVGIAHLALDGHWLRVNQRLCDIVGYTAEALAHKTFQELTHPADLSSDLNFTRQLLQGEIPFYTLHKRYFHQRGHIVWVNLTVSLVHHAAGAPDYFVAVIEDITKLKQAEQALLQSEDRYRRVVEDQVDFIARFQPDFKLTFVNHAYSAAFGKRPDEMIGQSVLDSIPPEYHERVIAHLSSMHPAQPIATNENPIQLADGTLRWFQWTNQLTLDEAGRTLEYQAVGRDMTDQKTLQAEQQRHAQALEEMRQFLESTLDAFPANIAVLDQNGTIIKINAAWQQFGEENGALVPMQDLDKNYLTICDTASGAYAEEATAVASGIRAVIAGTLPTFYLEYPCHGPTEKRWFGLRVKPFAEAPPRRVVVAHIDITERIQAEMAEQEQRRLAEALRDSLAALTSSLDVDSIMQRLLDYAAIVVPGETGSITLFEGDSGRLAYMRGFTPEAKAALLNYRIQIEPINFGDMLIDKQPYFIPDTHASPEWINIPFTEWIRSSIGIPIEIRKKIIGVLSVDSATPNHFQTTDIEKLQVFARYAGLALENVYHVNKLEQRVVERTAELQAAKERVEAILNNSFDGILLVHPDLRIQQTNTAFNTLVGSAPGEAFTGSLRDLIHLDDVERVNDVLQTKLQARTGQQLELHCYRKNGTLFDAELSISYIQTGGLVLTLRDITERKRAQNALAEERNLLRTLIDALPDLIYIKDLQHRFVLCNNASGHVLHDLSPENLIGKTDFDFFPLELAEQYQAEETAIFQTGQARLNHEQELVDPAGNVIWISTNKVPLYNLNGELIGLAGFSRDITVRKAHERQLRYQASLQENVNDAVIAEDLAFRIQSWNPAAEQMYGWRAEEVIGQFGVDRLHVGLTDEQRAHRRETILKEERWSGELTQRRKDGTELVVLSTVTLLKDEQGAPFGSVTVNHDITERKRAQNALAEERNLLRTLIDTIPDYIYIKDTNHRSLLSNIADARTFDMTPEQVVGKDDFALFPAEMARQFQADEVQLFQSGLPLINREEQSMGQNGRLIWASTTKVPLRNLEGEIIGLVGITRDISEHKARERQLRFHASLQENVTDAVIATDLNFRIQSWNPAAETIYGWRAAEVMDRPVNEVLQTQIPSNGTIEQARGEFLEKGYWTGETIQRHKTGHAIHILGSTVLFKDEQGIPIGVVSVNHDITERKKAEQAMQAKMEEERTFQNYLKALHEITIELTQIDQLDNFYKYVVVLGRSRLGFDRLALFLYDAQQNVALGTFGTDEEGKLNDERLIQFTPGPDDIMWRALQAAKRFSIEEAKPLYHNLAPVGFGWNAAAALWSGTQSIGWLVADNLIHQQPVTKPLLEIFALYALTIGTLLGRKKIEADLRESEARYRLLADNITDMVMCFDAAGNFIYASPSSHALIGFEPDVLVGQSGFDFIHPNDLAAIQELYGEVVSQPIPTAFTVCRFLHQAGHYLWLEFAIRMIRSEITGELLEIVVSARDITTRKQAENDLRESEHRFRRLVEAAPVAIIISDRAGQITLINQQASTLFGYSEVELLGQPIEVLAPEAIRQWQASERPAYMVAPAVRRIGFGMELFANRKDGSKFPVEIELSYIETKAGLVVMSFIVDITERKQNAAALEEQRTFLREVIDVSPSMIFVKDYAGRFVLANPVVAQMYNTTVEGLIGKGDADFNPDAQGVENFLAADQHVITTGEPLFIEEPLINVLGETYWLQTTKVPIISADGKSKHVLGVSTDITARKKAEEALRQNEELLRTVLENLPVGVWIIDLEGVIKQDNPVGQQIWGGSQVIGIEAYNEYKRWWDDIEKRIAADKWPGAQMIAEAIIQALTKGETSLNQELEIEAFDGTHKYLLNSVIPIRDPWQKIQGVLVVNQEITALKQNEKMIRQALEKEQELGELKSRFVSMASHEFRTPLASILALTETLRAYRHKLTNEQIELRLDKIQEQIAHLKDIMEDVLQLARVQARRTEFNPVLLDLDALCRSVLDEFESQPESAHRLQYRCKPMLNEVRLDKKLMRQLISNLVSNALKYSPPNKPIIVNLEHAGETLILQVGDEGIGIPAADLNHLFEPFHRAANVGTIAGTGLGLTIAKESVALHGGTITVESQVGIGTTFTVRIPVASKGKENDDNYLNH